jgi:steroid delta-isomerase
VALAPDRLRLAVDHYVAAINGREPVAIGALFTADAVQADPASGPSNIGREAITQFFSNGIAASEHWVFRAVDVHTCGSTIAIDFDISIVLGEGTMGVSGIEIFEVADDGLFSSAHAYWDNADVTFA